MNTLNEMTPAQIVARREELAVQVAAAIQAEGFNAKIVDDCGVESRILVSRQLSRKWQPMGYVDICDDGVANTKGIDRATSTIRDICKSVCSEAV